MRDSTLSTLPYADTYHTPIMVAEVLSWLNIQPGNTYIDATLGGGGHSFAMLDHESVVVHGLDRDPDAIAQSTKRLAAFGDRFTAHQCNYSQALDVVTNDIGHKVDGILLDAGVSSYQLNEASRGFSFMRSGPLDMRMGQSGESALSFLKTTDENTLSTILRDYGEIRSSRKVARVMLAAAEKGGLESTEDLRKVIESVLGTSLGNKTIHPATLVFQALRIHINSELTHLQQFVEAIPQLVKSGGRVVILSFHSLEDRIVKRGFRELANDCICPPRMPMCGCNAQAEVKILTRKPIRPTLQEIEHNPRSRSTLLRVVEVL